MEIIFNNPKSKYLEIISLSDLNDINANLAKFSYMKGPFEVQIFVLDDSIGSYQLLKLKNILSKINICSLRIYSNNRNTILAGKSLKINSNFVFCFQ